MLELAKDFNLWFSVVFASYYQCVFNPVKARRHPLPRIHNHGKKHQLQAQVCTKFQFNFLFTKTQNLWISYDMFLKSSKTTCKHDE